LDEQPGNVGRSQAVEGQAAPGQEWAPGEYRKVGIWPTGSTLRARARDPAMSPHGGGHFGSAGYRATELAVPPGSGAVMNGPVGPAPRLAASDPGRRARSGLVVDAGQQHHPCEGGKRPSMGQSMKR
jgi:hypothetical protein